MKQRTLELNIEAYSKEGHGVSHLISQEGKTSKVEVPFTMPNESVQALLIKKHKGTFSSRLEEVIKPSPQRIEPRCIHFGACGGCRWQHVPYALQLAQKEAWIRELLAPFLNAGTEWHPILPSAPWHYRNKMEFSFSSDLAGNRYLGLILLGSRGRVFNLKECFLPKPWFVQAAETVGRWWEETGLLAYKMGKDEGHLRTLTLRCGERTGDRMVILTVSGRADYALTKGQLKLFVDALKKAIEPGGDARLSIFLRIQQIAKGKPTNFYEWLLYGPDHIRETLTIHGKPLQFRISPMAFFQPNTEQAEKLYTRALDLGGFSQGSLIYDLYCGTGTLGICAAGQVKEVLGVDLSPESILDAKENVKLNNLSNAEFQKGDVGEVLKEWAAEGKKKPDAVLVDPPRAGLDAKAIAHLIDLKAPQLVYISCNPTSQAANMEPLLKAGYAIKAVQPVDQFPQTVHVENIVLLTMK
ncbi:MAG: 23S rRNA (uracil(1939)-C(5))-methyltransferase RlmD [Parachlamydia sp.]|nr:23S rRNA (uracil(1939)-C(5))-methyltransferase RlmD [Parachlamydia sp.]